VEKVTDAKFKVIREANDAPSRWRLSLGVFAVYFLLVGILTETGIIRPQSATWTVMVAAGGAIMVDLLRRLNKALGQLWQRARPGYYRRCFELGQLVAKASGPRRPSR